MKDSPHPDPDPVVEAYKKDIERTLIRENLKLTVEERFRNAMALARFADEMRRAGREAVSQQTIMCPNCGADLALKTPPASAQS
jgi:hypothetical protein